MKVVEFRHGFLSPSYEEQANEQGFTLGDQAEKFQKLGKYVLELSIFGIITDGETNKALQRLQKQFVKKLKPLEEDNNEPNTKRD